MSGQNARQQTRTRTGTMTRHTWRLAFGAVLVASAVAALTALPASAQQADETEADERIAELTQRLEETRERLQLTDEQIELLFPVLRENLEATAAVLEEYGIDLRSLAEGNPANRGRRLNLRQLRSLRGDLDEVQEEMLERIKELGFLSEEQLSEFRDVQEEQREVLRERIRGRRGGF